MRRWSIVVLVVCLYSLVGCEGGGGSCPWERPSCCDNVLFGCGPFDLPQGCSCGDYFSRSFQGAPLQSQSESARRALTTTEGTWRVTLTKSGDGCSYLKKQTTATVLIRERNQQVSLKLLGFVTLRGSRVGRTMRTRGRLKVPFSRCAADVKSDINLSSLRAGTVSGSVAVSCAREGLSCSATYSGSLKKL
jgi:hypothetical protein